MYKLLYINLLLRQYQNLQRQTPITEAPEAPGSEVIEVRPMV
jgi:hypothetical protein